ncbi:MAG: hypothetical protein MMC23_004988, partial [Stictis urceolatum]|nr:hypothetical protein [Stictis urceolata]
MDQMKADFVTTLKGISIRYLSDSRRKAIGGTLVNRGDCDMLLNPTLLMLLDEGDHVRGRSKVPNAFIKKAA